MTTSSFMQGPPRRPQPSLPIETDQQRADRVREEARMIEIARADVEAGRYLADEEADAWLDAWERGEPVAQPEWPSSPTP